MSALKSIVTDYYAAFSQRDFAKMKDFLCEDYHFTDPIDTAESAEEYINKVQILGSLVYESKITNTIEIENQIAVRFDWHLLEPKTKVIPMVEWFFFENGKIKSSELFFDAAQFAEIMQYLSPVEQKAVVSS